MATNLSLYQSTDRESDGPAMRLLTDRQRDFVLYYVQGRLSATASARKAGFATPMQYSWVLLRDRKVEAAIREETERLLIRSGPIGAHKLITIAETDGHKDQLKASRELIAHSGLAPVTEQRITVERTDRTPEAIRDRIRLLMSRIGPDATRLLESAGLVVDAEFNVVEDVEHPAE